MLRDILRARLRGLLKRREAQRAGQPASSPEHQPCRKLPAETSGSSSRVEVRAADARLRARLHRRGVASGGGVFLVAFELELIEGVVEQVDVPRDEERLPHFVEVRAVTENGVGSRFGQTRAQADEVFPQWQRDGDSSEVVAAFVKAERPGILNVGNGRLQLVEWSSWPRW
jgi:hypothetical protein